MSLNQKKFKLIGEQGCALLGFIELISRKLNSSSPLLDPLDYQKFDGLKGVYVASWYKFFDYAKSIVPDLNRYNFIVSEVRLTRAQAQRKYCDDIVMVRFDLDGDNITDDDQHFCIIDHGELDDLMDGDSIRAMNGMVTRIYYLKEAVDVK